MRCYQVTGTGMFRFAGTQASARETRDEIVEALGCKKKDVDIEEVEVPTSKEGLLEFLNTLVADFDNTDGEEEDEDDEEK